VKRHMDENPFGQGMPEKNKWLKVGERNSKGDGNVERKGLPFRVGRGGKSVREERGAHREWGLGENGRPKPNYT